MMPMKQLENMAFLWDTGIISPYSKDGDEIYAFRRKTSSQSVVRLLWQLGDIKYSCPYPCEPLPDRTGLVVYDNEHSNGIGVGKHLRILNVDNSPRCTLVIPNLGARSKTSQGWLDLPGNYDQLGVSFGVPGNDGHLDYIFDFDWQTGKLLRAVDAPYMRY